MEKQKLKVYFTRLSGDIETPITIYRKYVGDKIGFLLESKEQTKGRYSILSTDPFMSIRSYGNKVEVHARSGIINIDGRGLDEVKKVMEQYEVIENPAGVPFVGGAVGTVGYDVIKQYEKIDIDTICDLDTPDIHLLFVNESVIYDNFDQSIIITVLDEDTYMGEKRALDKIAQIKEKLSKDAVMKADNGYDKLEFESNVTQEEFMAGVVKAKKYIYDGDIFQVVLSQKFKAECEIPPFTLYRRLRRLNPSPYMYYFKFEDYYIVGSSPEMLARLSHDKIYNCPIAGTRKRGSTPEEDLELAKDLLSDEKEVAEHTMLVDLGRNDMGKVSKIGSVNIMRLLEVENYSHVMHIVSLLEGVKADDKDMFDVLMSFLPAGTLSGAPKIRAMEIIEELEKTKRGIYGGAIGYFGFDGTMDMCIAIRTMVIKDELVHIQAGAGIVADSIPENEFVETKRKAQALISALQSKL